MIKKILSALKSRTFWTVVVLFLVSGVDGIRETIPEGLQLPIDGFLTILAGYFRVNPRQ